jgi:DNA-binding phage protein
MIPKLLTKKMSFSVSKLEKFLTSKNLIPVGYFIMYNTCMYVDVISTTTADNFLLYIPSKYEFEMKPTRPNIYDMKYLEFDGSAEENVADEYAGKVDDAYIEDRYTEVDPANKLEFKDDFSTKLEDNYNKPITLKDVPIEDSKEIKDLLRQVKRVGFCLKNIEYKAIIIYKNYMCSIKRDDSIECYILKKYNSKKTKTLYVTTDLEVLYKDSESIASNVKTVRKELYRVLDKNHNNNMKTLQKIMDMRNEISLLSENAFNKKMEYEKMLKDSYKMFDNIKTSENEIYEKILALKDKYDNDPKLRNLNGDIERSHIISKLKTELTETKKIKEDVIKAIFELRLKRDHAVLEVDKIMFDNTVMIECVMKNLSQLSTV